MNTRQDLKYVSMDNAYPFEKGNDKMTREIAKQHLLNFLHYQLTMIDFVDTRAAKRSLYDQTFGAVMYYTTTSCAENSYFADVEVLWKETYKPKFEEKIYG